MMCGSIRLSVQACECVVATLAVFSVCACVSSMCFCQFGFSVLISGFLWCKVSQLKTCVTLLGTQIVPALPGHPEKPINK